MSLFSYYPGSPELIAAAGEEFATLQASYDTLQTNLDSRSAAAADEAMYEIKEPVATAAQAARVESEELAGAAMLANGALRYFGQAVNVYNAHIDALNATYDRARASKFGHPLGEDSGAEEQALRARLEKERQGYESALDDEADLAGCLLSDGATPECMLTLYLLGALPADDVTRVTGLSLEYLNQARMVIGTTQFVLTSKKWLPVLAQYLRKVNPTEIKMVTTLKLAQLVEEFGSAVNRGKVAEIYSAVQRMDNMVAVSRPGALVAKFGTTGLLGGVNKWVGRLLSPGAVLAGGWGLFQTFENWESLAVVDRVNGIVGNASFMTFGSLGTAMLITGWCPPVAGAIATVAGLVALGSMILDYREEIWAGMQWVGAKIADGAVYAWNATSDWVDEQATLLGDLWEDSGDLAVGIVTSDIHAIADGASGILDSFFGGETSWQGHRPGWGSPA